MTYPIEFRKKIMRLHEAGMKYEEIEQKYLVSIRTLTKKKKERTRYLKVEAGTCKTQF